jgi:integrase
LKGYRFHDLRHQAITEMAEAGAPDATIKAVAGHIDQTMMEHYSHVRMAAKRDVLEKLAGGLMGNPAAEREQGQKVN